MTLNQIVAAGAFSLAAALPVAAHNVVFTADLLGSSEASPNNSAGTGSATLTFNEHTLSLRVQADFSGLSGDVSMSHIHCCTALPTSGNAAVAVDFSDFPKGGKAGVYDRTFDMTQLASWSSAFVSTHGGTVDLAFIALEEGIASGKGYLNIHTSAFPGGELRGNFTAAVPEPQSALLMLAGLVGVAGVAQRRRVA